MSRPSIIPEILAVLEPYLEDKASAYAARRVAMRNVGSNVPPEPTLPITNDGKINVLAVVRELGLPSTSRQHLYKPEIAKLLDREAAAQGLSGIGSRGSCATEEAIDRVARAEAKLSACMSQSAEREALIAQLRRENEGLRRQLALLAETGLLMRTGKI